MKMLLSVSTFISCACYSRISCSFSKKEGL